MTTEEQLDNFLRTQPATVGHISELGKLIMAKLADIASQIESSQVRTAAALTALDTKLTNSLGQLSPADELRLTGIVAASTVIENQVGALSAKVDNTLAAS